MKNTLVTLLASILVLSTAPVTVASPANPWTDVPANHWAYSAVTQLAKDGVVHGYDNGTFNGDKAITRYEMAEIVAKALAREDKATAQDKALIDKLATEFAAELNNIGVRLTKVENKQGNILFSADGRLRFVDQKTNYAKFGDRLRLSATGDINDNLSFAVRDCLINQTEGFGNNTNNANGTENQIYEMNFTYHTPTFNVTGGRFSLTLGQTGYLIGSQGGFEGFKANWTSGKGHLLFGYANAGIMDSTTSSFALANVGYAGKNGPGFAHVRNVYFGQYNFAPDTNNNFGVMYVKSQSQTSDTSGGPGDNYAHLLDIIGGSMHSKFAPNFAIQGDYWVNKSSFAKQLANTSNLKGYAAKLIYRPDTLSYAWVNPKLKPGDWGAFVEYARFDPYTLDNCWAGPNLLTSSNQKYFDFDYSVILAKGASLDLIYMWDIKPVNLSSTYQNTGDFFRVQLNFAF